MSRPSPTKYRARELIWQVPPGQGEAYRNVLRQKAQALVIAQQRYLKALGMVNLDDGSLRVYVLVNGEKRPLSWFHNQFGTLLSPDAETHQLWNEPGHGGGSAGNERIETSLLKFRTRWNVQGAHYEEIPGEGGQHGPIIESMDDDINRALELLTDGMPAEDVSELSDEDYQELMDSFFPQPAYRSLSAGNTRADLIARVRTELRAHFAAANNPVAAAADGGSDMA